MCFPDRYRIAMSDTSSAEWPPWMQAGLFFLLAFGGIQGISALLQGGVTLPALVSAGVAAVTGAGIVYSYEWRRQAGVFEQRSSDENGRDRDERSDTSDDDASSPSTDNDAGAEAAPNSTEKGPS